MVPCPGPEGCGTARDIQPRRWLDVSCEDGPLSLGTLTTCDPATGGEQHGYLPRDKSPSGQPPTVPQRMRNAGQVTAPAGRLECNTGFPHVCHFEPRLLRRCRGACQAVRLRGAAWPYSERDAPQITRGIEHGKKGHADLRPRGWHTARYLERIACAPPNVFALRCHRVDLFPLHAACVLRNCAPCARWPFRWQTMPFQSESCGKYSPPAFR